MTFDDAKAYDAASRDPKASKLTALAKTSLSSSTALVEASSQFGGESIVENFSDDYYVVQVDVDLNGGTSAEIWGKYVDAHNGTMLKLDSSGNWDLYSYGSGGLAILGSGTYTTGASVPVRIKFNSTSPLCEVYINGSLKYNAAGGSGFGGVAFGGDKPKFDNVKIGYDNNGDDDIDDAGDDVVINESFSSTSQTVSYDHAGNLIDDGQFQYVYDAWNRLIKVRSAGDTDVTIQTAEFFADGRRAKKVVTNAGAYDGTEVYFHDGQKIIETRDGSGNVKKQFIHGTQYIDELIMERIFDKGDFYVHQAERDHGGSVKDWNVIAVTDMRAAGGGIAKIVERYVYTPYGEVNVMQAECDQGGSMKGFGDRDGDEDVDSTDKGTVGTTCNTTPVTGSCRILDLDFDGDYDSTDATKFDSLTQGIARHPGKFASGVDQPFGHQGLQYEPELAQYQNRARQYDPGTRRFVQRDPDGEKRPTSISFMDGLSLYCNRQANTLRYVDPLGLSICTDHPGPWGGPTCPAANIQDLGCGGCTAYTWAIRFVGPPIGYPLCGGCLCSWEAVQSCLQRCLCTGPGLPWTWDVTFFPSGPASTTTWAPVVWAPFPPFTGCGTCAFPAVPVPPIPNSCP